MSEILVVDDLIFELRRSRRRKSLGITVDRDGSLTIDAPADMPRDQIEQAVRDRRFAIYSKVAEKELLLQEPAPKRYVSGEGFYYLGRSYRLELIDPGRQARALRLFQGHFYLRRDKQRDARQHFIDWYTARGRAWVQKQIGPLAERVGVTPGAIQVRDLGYRWGSCSQDGSLNFHWRTIQLPPRIVEYVVVHELVHLIEPHHTEAFWRLLERAMPDMGARRKWLAQNGSGYSS